MLYTSFVRQIPERNLYEIRENLFPAVVLNPNWPKFFPAKHKESAICEIELTRKFHATR